MTTITYVDRDKFVDTVEVFDVEANTMVHQLQASGLRVVEVDN